MSIKPGAYQQQAQDFLDNAGADTATCLLFADHVLTDGQTVSAGNLLTASVDYIADLISVGDATAAADEVEVAKSCGREPVVIE
ncbi:hypothetical protein ACQE3E_06640 [Methylomonas sp. MED-D]|uniref:hypothetical protein n=1 Tax=Methylomonas sp. MED-D TaxID=3418768 RepID=UPI003D01C762